MSGGARQELLGLMNQQRVRQQCRWPRVKVFVAPNQQSRRPRARPTMRGGARQELFIVANHRNRRPRASPTMRGGAWQELLSLKTDVPPSVWPTPSRCVTSEMIKTTSKNF
jgi:hypothetical protein